MENESFVLTYSQRFAKLPGSSKDQQAQQKRPNENSKRIKSNSNLVAEHNKRYF